MLATVKSTLLFHLSYIFNAPFITTPIVRSANYSNANSWVVRNSFWWTLWYSIVSNRNLFLYDIRRIMDPDPLMVAWITMDSEYRPQLWAVSHTSVVIHRLTELMDELLYETSLVRHPIYACPQVTRVLQKLDPTFTKVCEPRCDNLNFFASAKVLNSANDTTEILYARSLAQDIDESSDNRVVTLFVLVFAFTYLLTNLFVFVLQPLMNQ